MADEFVAITTQDAFDAAIKERINRAETQVHKQYADYEQLKTASATSAETIRGHEATIKAHEATIAQQAGELKTHQLEAMKARAAMAAGLPFAALSRLQGDTEDAIKKDAESLAKLIGQHTTTPPPTKNTETGTGTKEEAALRGVLDQMMERGN